MPKRRAGLWESIGRSFDPGFYANIVNQAFGRSLAYLLLLSAITSLAFSLTLTVNLYRSTAGVKSWVRAHIDEIWPQGVTEIKLVNGVVSSDGPQPSVHKWSKDFFFIIDTTGKTNSLEGYEQGLLLTKNKFAFKVKKQYGASETKEGDLSKAQDMSIARADTAKEEVARVSIGKKNFVVGPELIQAFMGILGVVTFIFSFFLFLILNFIIKLIHAAVFSVIPLLISSMGKAPLKYNSIINVSIYALTPATLISVLVSVVARLRFGLPPQLYLVVYIIYVALILKNIKEPSVNHA